MMIPKQRSSLTVCPKTPTNSLFSVKNNHGSDTTSQSGNICRICHSEGEAVSALITPCFCSGSLRYVHENCIQHWVETSKTDRCELCKFKFVMETKTKPLRNWNLDMPGTDRRKLVCAVLFHIVALLCVIWLLYFLVCGIEEETRKGKLEWLLWTKLVMASVLFVASIILMYIPCKGYFVICRKLKQYNRIVTVKNAPDTIRHKTQVPRLKSSSVV